MIKKLIPALWIMFSVIGCVTPKIDASSDESFRASITNVRQSLSRDERARFDEALNVIAFGQLTLKNSFAVHETREKMKGVLKGKTGEEVIIEAERISREQKK